MEFKINQKPAKKHLLFITDGAATLEQAGLTPEEITYAAEAIQKEQSLLTYNHYSHFTFVLVLKKKPTENEVKEACRKAGAELQTVLNKKKITEVTIANLSSFISAAYHVAEGIALSNYQFLKYFKDAQKLTHTLQQINFTKQAITVKEMEQLKVITEATYRVRTLVNEPPNYMTAVQLAKELTAMGKEAGFKVNVLQKDRIVKEKMGGLLSVNLGSIDPPTFTVMEYQPAKAINKKPIVLVGKGVVYDTGGLSLKPTANSMDRMKSDMSGAALVGGAMYTIARLKLPIHVIALAPATDNRPGELAYVPGDIITMYSGTTVEVLNTDAEGRLILADALHWAKKYKPELVIDFATLTGAAAAALGDHGIVCMGTADDTTKQKFKNSGDSQHERLVEFPLWEAYGEMIKSDFADLKNIGGPVGGAITAGKFLQHFTDYPWMHFDIAGVSYGIAKRGYYPSGGTAYGMRMLLDFLMHYGKA